VRLRIFIAGIAAMTCLVVPASAFATSLSNDVYSSQGAHVLGAAAAGDDSGTPPSPTVAAVETTEAPEVVAVEAQSAGASTLPFTGFQAGIVALIGVGLLGGGLMLWRFNRSPRNLGA
jgi:hypothetical protein